MEQLNLTNLSLTEIVKALQEQNLQKYDFVIPSRYMKMIRGNLSIINRDELDEVQKLFIETGIQSLTVEHNKCLHLESMDSIHAQISQRLDIPKRYYDRMLYDKKNVELLDSNVNHWLSQNDKNYLLRTFVNKEKNEGYARAILSDRYSVIDNYDVMLATLDAVRESGMNIQIESGDITDRKFFMRFILPDIEIQAPEILKNYRTPKTGNKNNGIITGFVISNSETGYGKFSISPRAVVLACSNGMVFKNDSFQKTHLGVKMDEYSSIDWSQETRQKNYELVISQVKDAITTFASKEYLGAKISEIQEKGNKELNHPLETMKNVTKHLSISDDKEKSILNYFIQGGTTNAFGVTQALTYFAQHDASPEERYDLERESISILHRIEDFDRQELKVKTSTMSLN
jgi:hypothetical protein